MERSWIDVEQLRRHRLDCSIILSEGRKRKQQESGTVSALQGDEKGTGATITRAPQGQCSVLPGNRVREGTKRSGGLLDFPTNPGGRVVRQAPVSFGHTPQEAANPFLLSLQQIKPFPWEQ